MLEDEPKVVPSKKLLHILEESVLVATGIIMKLHKRNNPILGSHQTEGNQAIHMLKEMLNKIPEVMSKPINFHKPLQHIIVEKHLRASVDLSRKEMFMDHDICKLLLEVVDDINEVDNEGNTLLLIVAKLLQLDYSELNTRYYFLPPLLEVVDF